MHSLYLVRHAKSSWAEPGLKDSSRPLNKRGKRDAPMMGKLLKNIGEIPDLMVSSPAKRAYSTAKLIAIETGYQEKFIIINESLYMADIEDFVCVIENVNTDIKKLMLFSHNYGITNFANFISSSDIEIIPTCGIVKINFDFDSWKKINNEKGKIEFFEYPKKYPNGV